MKSCLEFITFVNTSMMIARLENNLGEHLSMKKLIKELINVRQRVLVLDCELVQSSTVNAQRMDVCFFLTRMTRAPKELSLSRCDPCREARLVVLNFL